jgi:hypothetical protein
MYRLGRWGRRRLRFTWDTNGGRRSHRTTRWRLLWTRHALGRRMIACLGVDLLHGKLCLGLLLRLLRLMLLLLVELLGLRR